MYFRTCVLFCQEAIHEIVLFWYTDANYMNRISMVLHQPLADSDESIGQCEEQQRESDINQISH